MLTITILWQIATLLDSGVFLDQALLDGCSCALSEVQCRLVEVSNLECKLQKTITCLLPCCGGEACDQDVCRMFLCRVYHLEKLLKANARRLVFLSSDLFTQSQKLKTLTN